MDIIGTVELDERSIVRNGSTATLTLTNIPYKNIFIDGVAVAITPGVSSFVARRATSRGEIVKTDIIHVNHVYEYRIDDEKQMVLMLKFSFTDIVPGVSSIDILPSFANFIRYRTALAVEVVGAFDGMSRIEFERYMAENFSTISHLGVTYHLVRVAAMLTVHAEVPNESMTDKIPYDATYGILAAYSSIIPSNTLDTEGAIELLNQRVMNR